MTFAQVLLFYSSILQRGRNRLQWAILLFTRFGSDFSF